MVINDIREVLLHADKHGIHITAAEVDYEMYAECKQELNNLQGIYFKPYYPEHKAYAERADTINVLRAYVRELAAVHKSISVTTEDRKIITRYGVDYDKYIAECQHLGKDYDKVN